MNATDTEFYSAFAGRVRQQLADTTPKGGAAMTTSTDTRSVPATFKAAPGSECAMPWCVEDGPHVEHVGRLVNLPAVEAQLWQDADSEPVTVIVGNSQDDYRTLTSGDQLRGEAARVRSSAARLDALADQFDAIRDAQPEPTPGAFTAGRDSAGEPETPRTWSFINRYNGHAETVTCMTGCTTDHRQQMGQELFPADVTCSIGGPDAGLPVAHGSDDPEDVDVLRFGIYCTPYSQTLAARLPNVCLDILENDGIEHMGPDELQTVIGVLQGQLDALRAAHAQLVNLRAEYLARTAGGAR